LIRVGASPDINAGFVAFSCREPGFLRFLERGNYIRCNRVCGGIAPGTEPYHRAHPLINLGETQEVTGRSGTAFPRSVAALLQIGELAFPDDAGVAVALTLDLVLEHATGFRHLTRHYEDFPAVGDLTHFRGEADLLPDREFMCWQPL